MFICSQIGPWLCPEPRTWWSWQSNRCIYQHFITLHLQSLHHCCTALLQRLFLSNSHRKQDCHRNHRKKRGLWFSDRETDDSASKMCFWVWFINICSARKAGSTVGFYTGPSVREWENNRNKKKDFMIHIAEFLPRNDWVSTVTVLTLLQIIQTNHFSHCFYMEILGFFLVRHPPLKIQTQCHSLSQNNSRVGLKPWLCFCSILETTFTSYKCTLQIPVTTPKSVKSLPITVLWTIFQTSICVNRHYTNVYAFEKRAQDNGTVSCKDMSLQSCNHFANAFCIREQKKKLTLRSWSLYSHCVSSALCCGRYLMHSINRDLKAMISRLSLRSTVNMTSQNIIFLN